MADGDHEGGPIPAALHWSISEFAEVNEGKLSTDSPEEDLHSVLALAQKLGFHFLPITWQSGLGLLGRGNTADKSLKALVAELKVLGTPGIKGHPGIIECEGICFERKPGFSELLPVLVFPRASHGTLKQFMGSPEGMRASMKERIQICITLAAAIKQLHQSNYVHGDLKPENVLVFDDDGGVTARVADLGYARNGTDREIVVLAVSRPWFPGSQSPEMTMSCAKRVDVYALSMLCFWLLLLTPLKETERNTSGSLVSIDKNAVYESAVRNLQRWQSSGSLLEKAHMAIQSQADLSEQDKIELRRIFDLGLNTDASSIDARSANLFKIWQNIGRYKEPDTLTSRSSLSDSSDCHPILQVIPAMYELALCSYHVRAVLFKRFEKKVKLGGKLQSCQHCKSKVAYQLACCYFLGFGTRRDVRKSECWLDRAGGSKNYFLNEVQILLDQNLADLFRDSLFRDLLEDGQVFLADLIDHDKQDRDESLTERLEQEAHDFEELFGPTHDITILSKLGIAVRARRQRISKDMLKGIHMLSFSLDQIPSRFALLSMRCTLAILLREQGKWRAAEELFVTISAILRSGDFPIDHPLSIGVLANLASCQFMQEKLDEAELGFKRALAVSEKILSPQHPETISNMANLGAVMRSKGRLSEAEQLGRKAMTAAQNLLGYSHPTRIAVMSSLASTLYTRGAITETASLLSQLKDLSLSDTESWAPESILNLSKLANILSEIGHFKGAESLAQQILDRQQEVLNLSDPIMLQIMLNLCAVLWACGRHSECEQVEARLSERISSVENPEHSYNLSLLENRAVSLKRKGQTKTAESFQKEVAKIRTERLGEDHPETLKAKFNLALTLHENNDFYKAREMCEDAVHRSSEILGPQHPDTLRRRLEQISMIRDGGDAGTARSLEEDVLKICYHTLGHGHPVTLHAKGNLAMSLWQIGEDQKAADAETEILKTYQGSLGEKHPHTLIAKARLGSSLLNIDGRAAEAEGFLSEVFAAYEAEWSLQDLRTLTMLSEVALANAKLSRFEKAAEMLEQVVKIRIQILGMDHTSTIRAATNLFHVCDHLRELQEAKGATNHIAFRTSSNA